MSVNRLYNLIGLTILGLCLIIPLASSADVFLPLDVISYDAETSDPVLTNNERASFADCGVANDAGSSKNSRIVGGEETKPNEFPWIAFLNIEMESGTTYSCAGSLIAEKWIVTSAGCVTAGGDKAKAIYVHLGVHNRSSSSNEATGRLYMGHTVIVHSAWNPYTIDNDIALICLKTPVTFSQYIRPVCLANANEPSYDGKNATVAGWGRISDGSTTSSAVLRKVTVPVISNAKCNAYYGNTIANEVVCTDGMNGRGACNGDGGAPLNFKQPDGTWKQIGVSSFISTAGCQTGGPSGFTRMSSYSTWIQNNIAIDCSPPTTTPTTSTSSTTVSTTSTTLLQTTTTTTTESTTPTTTTTKTTTTDPTTTTTTPTTTTTETTTPTTTTTLPTTTPTTTTTESATTDPTTTTTTESTTKQPTTFDCTGKPNGNYPNPVSTCSNTFYMCSNENAYLYDCASNLVYREDVATCDWPQNVAGCR